MKNLASTVITFLLFTTVAFAQTTYTLDKNHARVAFSAVHYGISNVEGNFKTFDATLESQKEDLTDAVFTFTADVNSVNTDVEYRDNDLRSPHFFDIANYPTMTFKSTAFRKINGKNYKLNGMITIHGMTRNIQFDVIFNGVAITAMKKPTAGFTITGKLNRLDFGVGGSPETNGVSNEIQLKSNLEFTISGK